MNEIDIINDMLAAVGERPVLSLDAGHPLVHMARNKLSLCNTAVQTKVPWWFNTAIGTYSPNADGFVVVPSNTIKVIPKRTREKITVRAGKLYSISKRAYVNAPIELEVTTLVDYDELPMSVANYLRAYAVAEFVRDRQEEYNIRRERDVTVQGLYAIAHREHMRVVKPNRADSAAVRGAFKHTNPYREL